MCIRLNSVGSRPGGRLQMKELLVLCKSFRRLQNGEETMAESKESLVVELHTKAAYAHIAAAHEHSTGDHASPQQLARKALGDSVEAVKYSEGIAKDTPRSMEV